MRVATSWTAVCEKPYKESPGRFEEARPAYKTCNAQKYEVEVRCEACTWKRVEDAVYITPTHAGRVEAEVTLRSGKTSKMFKLPPFDAIGPTDIHVETCTIQGLAAVVDIGLYGQQTRLPDRAFEVTPRGGTASCVHDVASGLGNRFVCPLPAGSELELDVNVKDQHYVARGTCTSL